jgi:hypothetical protein
MNEEIGGEEEGSGNDKGSQTDPGMISTEKEIQTEVFDSRKCILWCQTLSSGSHDSRPHCVRLKINLPSLIFSRLPLHSSLQRQS